MSNGELSGYDSAQKDRKNDDLGPWRFAAEIAEVIRSTPPEWSARIGTFGKRGEGKCTILYFLEEMLKPEGNIIFSFNPWAIQDLNELWAEFGTKLLEALASNNLLAEPWWARRLRVSAAPWAPRSTERPRCYLWTSGGSSLPGVRTCSAFGTQLWFW